MALNINGTTGISGVDGSVSAPAVTGTDSNTGITFPAADTIKFSTGGVERISITNSGISGTGISAGITMADMWRISSSFTGVSSSAYITANWERVDTDGFGQLGTGMTESSGEFTFPSTGIYLIDFRGRGSKGNGEVQYAGIKIHVTTDNSSYSEAANSFNGSGGTGYFYAISCQHILDVTSTSTHKVKFQFEASHPADLHGNSNYTDSGVTFIRLGDT